MALRGCPSDVNNDYSRIRAATHSDCGFLCICVGQVALLVEQGNPLQRSCRLNAAQIQIFALCSCDNFPFNGQTHPMRDVLRRLGFERHPVKNPLRNAARLRHLDSQFRPLSQHELGALSGLEAGLLVHAFQLRLHVQRHGVSSS